MKVLVFSLFIAFMLPGESAVSALTRFGAPKYPATFSAFDFVNPKAPKGGTLTLGALGTFDSINEYVAKGVPVTAGLSLIIDPLMRRAVDEPMTFYALIAEKVDLAPDASHITFYLNPKAKFHDGHPILATDVQFSYTLLKEKGLPRYRLHYGKIERYEILDCHTIRLHFHKGPTGYDPELPLICAGLRVLPKHIYEKVNFQETGLSPISGSGPYKIKSVEAGRRIVYERVKDYWAADLPVNRGLYNFDRIRIDYYKNANAQFLAFKSGAFDVHFEVNSMIWNQEYEFPGVQEGRVQRVSAIHRRPVTIRTLIFNMRKPLFHDARLRQALNLAFDWETTQKIHCNGDYQRVTSLFANTPLAHTGIAQGWEKKILQEGGLAALIPKAYNPPKTDGKGHARENLVAAHQLLEEAGWKIQLDSKGRAIRRHKDTGAYLTFEFMYKDQRIEKFLTLFRRNLAILGIHMNLRFMDTVQYEKRVIESDFDMISHMWTNSLMPGKEQEYYFSQATADQKGSSNYIGVKDSLLENLAKRVTTAQTAEEHLGATHALDRAVMNAHLMIPMFYDNNFYFAYWADRVTPPTYDPEVGTNAMEWWWAAAPICEISANFPPMSLKWMTMALEIAQQAANVGEVPVGAVIVCGNDVLASSGNQVEALKDGTAHAEMRVIKEAMRQRGDRYLTGCDLYVTLEPCPMCAGAISLARIRRLYFGAYDPKGGGVDHGARVFDHPTCHHVPEVIGGLCSLQSQRLLQPFFQEKRREPNR